MLSIKKLQPLTLKPIPFAKDATSQCRHKFITESEDKEKGSSIQNISWLSALGATLIYMLTQKKLEKEDGCSTD